jgi:hypothetical protein
MKMPRKLAKKPRSWSSNICNKYHIQSLVTFWGTSNCHLSKAYCIVTWSTRDRKEVINQLRMIPKRSEILATCFFHKIKLSK